ncbi:MAG: glycoside hydrolase family 9 protein, partial [Candidatus Hydrogenedentes bacterium]|nr:glycoside hydrolase family 9 protein [Candidatus Hydrogenedentota bacterium]
MKRALRQALMYCVGFTSLAAAQESGSDATSETVTATTALLENGGFEQDLAGQPPAGWMALAGGDRAQAVDAAEKLAGSASLRVEPGSATLALASLPMDVAAGLETVSGVVMARGAENLEARLRWLRGAADGFTSTAAAVREDAFILGGPGAWRRLTLSEVTPPDGAHALQLVLVTPPSETPVWWDQIQLTGVVRQTRQVKVLVNQVGYEIGAPKKFTVATNFPAETAQFRVMDESDEEVFSGALSGGETITSGGDRAWGDYYWRGDFTAFEFKGVFTVEAELGEVRGRGPAFEVDVDLLWKRTFEPVWRCFTYHRCGTNVEGYHAACHLDDTAEGVSLAGGWHEGSTYGKASTPWLAWKLAAVCDTIGWRLKKETPPGEMPSILEETAWGADLVARAVGPSGAARPMPMSKPGYWGAPEAETDNLAGSGDERPVASLTFGNATLHTAMLARAAHLLWPERSLYRETAQRGLEWALAQHLRTPYQFEAAYELWTLRPPACTEENLHDLALALGAAPEVADSVVDYETTFGTGVLMNLVTKLQAQADELLQRADNPFGVCARGTGPQAQFFEAPEQPADLRHGNTRFVLEAAETVAKAYRFVPRPEYLAFILDQFNWVLGNNPFGVSLVEGAGTAFLPSYYHGYSTTGLARGAVPGAVAEGIAARGPSDDRPWLDLSGAEKPYAGTNAVSLVNNACYLGALAQLKRTPMEGELPP